MKGKREWFVAVGDMSGEYAGNPLCFDASKIYGPYTAEQALEISELGDRFESETYDVRIFKINSRPTFKDLKSLINGLDNKRKAWVETEDGTYVEEDE